ncbi:MAG: flagellar export protein FliJ [Fibrobacter sp.]|nr:flagellar export protein FliJ [Fibrobacter sp.]
MKKFKFTLDTLLDVRQKKEDKLKSQLAEKNREIIQLQKEVNQIHDELKEFQSSEIKSRVENKVDPVLLRYSVTYRFKLKDDILKLVKQIDDLKAEAWKINAKLIEAVKDRRAIEILKEKRFQEWRKEYNMKEQKTIDDISQQVFIRNSGSKFSASGSSAGK